jgi:2-octaprenyl-6-methoxyphenol hydroxylase
MLIQGGVPANTIALIDAKSAEAAQGDPRSIALSYGSRQLLEKIHGWPLSATPITEIHISRRGSFGRTLIASSEYHLPALGYVCRYGQLVHSLSATLQNSGLAILRPVSFESQEEDPQGVQLKLSDGSLITSKLVVQAEGGVYGAQSAKGIRRDYQQSALVATVHTNTPSTGRAFERFTEAGPLALLPQDDGYALVWCARPNQVESLLGLPDAEFLQALQQAFGERVGRFHKVGVRTSYALGLNADPAASARSIAIGNAAQTLHPVAGQGLNLGLRDAAVLASLLPQARSPSTLAEFLVRRRSDRQLTMRLTDLMARVFASAPDTSFSQGLLGLSLGLVDVLPRVKRGLAEQMMFGWR